jgi:hypothetical protein
MPFALLIVFAFALGIIWKKEASRQTYVVFFLGAAAATIYFLR